MALALPDQAIPSQLALRVALQTMKERCISLQKRLTAVEEENQELRDRLESEPNAVKLASSAASVVENFQLRNQVGELNRQKQQLSEHINMVSNENRKLWSRLSQMAKDQNIEHAMASNAAKEDADSTFTNDTAAASPRNSSSVNQNLIRSKTFTQHSPNPNLRHKIMPQENVASELRDLSLEEVVLDAFPDIGINGGKECAAEVATESELGFAYLNVDEAGSDSELNTETKKCIEGFDEIRREALQHQEDLNAALTLLETKIVRTHCPDCERKSQKPEMADKSLETDDSLSELKLYSDQQAIKYTDSFHTQTVKLNTDEGFLTGTRLNILQEKVKADELDRTCPMCGKLFSSAVQFVSFREHVETHFIEDASDLEPSLERNYEFISHAVGDF